MQDEYSREDPTHLLDYGLMTKVYAMKLVDTESTNAKGVSTDVVKKQLTHSDYKQ